VLEDEVEGRVDGIIYRPVGSLGKLLGVQEWVCSGVEVVQHQALKRLHYHRQRHVSVVIMSCDPWLFGDRDDGGSFKAGWYMACVEDALFVCTF